MSVAQESLRLSALFEAELLVELMLRYWNHPLAADAEFRNDLLETSVSALQASTEGTRLFETLAPHNMSLVAAVWYAEWNTLNTDPPTDSVQFAGRRAWTDAVRRALPSCFCDPDILPQ